MIYIPCITLRLYTHVYVNTQYKMSFNGLPMELQKVIMDNKNMLETETYDAFVACFNVKVISRKTTPILNGSYAIDRILIHYKPFNKYMIITHKHTIYDNHQGSICPSFIIAGLLLNIETFNDECAIVFDNAELYTPKWGTTISYDMYCKINNMPENSTNYMTLRNFCEWRRDCSRFKKLLGDRFEQLWSLTESNF